LFGRVSNIADLGALGRLGAISLVWDAIQRSVFVPHFAKASFQSNLGRKYLGLLLLSSIPTLTLMLIIMIAPDAVLWILGPHYAHLKKEIVVTGLFLVIVGLQGSTQTLNLARGWVVPGWMTVGCGLFLPILSTRLLNLSTVSGVLTMNICLSLAGFVQNVGLAIRRVSATPTVSVERIPVDQEL
jgi:hypothetical protein